MFYSKGYRKRADPYEQVSSIIKSSLATLMLAISDGEERVEAQRQHLCGMNDFEPYAAFSRIDRKSRGVVTASDMLEFLESVGMLGDLREAELTLLVRYYDSEPIEHAYCA